MKKLSKAHIRKIVRSRRGGIANIARRLGISHTAVILWLNSKSKSQRIAVAAEQYAREILAEKEAA